MICEAECKAFLLNANSYCPILDFRHYSVSFHLIFTDFFANKTTEAHRRSTELNQLKIYSFACANMLLTHFQQLRRRFHKIKSQVRHFASTRLMTHVLPDLQMNVPITGGKKQPKLLNFVSYKNWKKISYVFRIPTYRCLD